jgi:hypothetical protein
MSTRRCPVCGGLVSADLEWCSQCFTRFEDAQPERETTERPEANASPGNISPPADAAEGRTRVTPSAVQGERALRVVEEGRVLWDCPVCGQENDLAERSCTRCGTTFGRLFEEPTPPPRISPQRAAVLSLVFPGTGHVAAGRVADGLARGVVFAFVLTMVVVSLAAGGVGGPLLSLVVLFAGSGATLYAATAVDAYRAVRQEPPVLSTRLLLIGATILLLVAVAILILGSNRLT